MNTTIALYEGHGFTGIFRRREAESTGVPKHRSMGTARLPGPAAPTDDVKPSPRQSSPSEYTLISIRQVIQNIAGLSNALPAYEGDGFIRISPSRSAADAGTPEQTPSRNESDEWSRPFLAVRDAMVRFFDWLDNKANEARMRDVEAYLAKSTDIADLEHRMRDLERGCPRMPFG